MSRHAKGKGSWSGALKSATLQDEQLRAKQALADGTLTTDLAKADAIKDQQRKRRAHYKRFRPIDSAVVSKIARQIRDSRHNDALLSILTAAAEEVSGRIISRTRARKVKVRHWWSESKKNAVRKRNRQDVSIEEIYQDLEPGTGEPRAMRRDNRDPGLIVAEQILLVAEDLLAAISDKKLTLTARVNLLNALINCIHVAESPINPKSRRKPTPHDQSHSDRTTIAELLEADRYRTIAGLRHAVESGLLTLDDLYPPP